jgi:hypothetical protein
VVHQVCNGSKLKSLVVGNQIVHSGYESGTFGLLMIWRENMLHPFGMQHASYAVEAMGICRLLQTSSLQATDKLSQHTGDGDFGSCSCAAITLPLKV